MSDIWGIIMSRAHRALPYFPVSRPGFDPLIRPNVGDGHTTETQGTSMNVHALYYIDTQLSKARAMGTCRGGH